MNKEMPSLADPGGRRLFLFILLAGLATAAFFRFVDLGRSALRSDEINFFFGAARDSSLVELWRHPPWLEQIPLADSVPIVWMRLTGMEATEQSIRLPFAGMGWATVLLCALWLWRRRRWAAAAVCAVWLGLLPFHVYHSREAYYYATTMFLATGMFLRTLEILEQLGAGAPVNRRTYVHWLVWTALACLGHPTAWPCAGGAWLVLILAGWSCPKGIASRRHWNAMSVATAFMGIWMSRWVYRSILKVFQDFMGDKPLLGGVLSWIGPRVLPIFAGGTNVVGWSLAIVVAFAAVWPLLRGRRSPGQDALLAHVARLLGITALFVAAYVMAIGKGTAKLVYFAAPLSLLHLWAVLVLDRFCAGIGPRARRWGMLGFAVLVAGTLAYPAWQVTRLEGKTTAYRTLRAWLDANLAPGDVAIVDRWYEPWNEMALYAPSNVFVTFTVPDEPYENYVGYNWRKTTQTAFERNGAQAFIRIARNHEKRAGLWSWPEKWFAHHAVVTNAAGVWLRDTGFAPMEEFYSETNRVATEIFYDTHADVAARARAAGQDAVWFFGAGWRLFKPWQQGDFTDYRVLEDEGAMEVRNLRDVPVKLTGEVVAAAMGGEQRVRIGELPPLAFPEGRLERRTFALDLPAGVQTLRWKKLGAGGALLVRDFRLGRAE